MSFRAGISPEVFWSLTPWQLSVCLGAYSEKLEQEHDHNVWIMWHGAVLHRVNKLPPMTDFLSGKKTSKGIDERAIMARLRAYQNAVGVKNG